MTVPSLSALLKKYQLRPRKGLGQNFLADPFHLAKILEAAELTPTDIVVEIGPGPGPLTRLLVEEARQVIAVELDPNMVDLLEKEYGHYSNLTVVQADILQTDMSRLFEPLPFASRSPVYKVVANLPYYITSAVIRHLLEAALPPVRLVITVQKEVARRIVAEPGAMSLLAVSVQFYGQSELVHQIPAGAFYPPPKVDSAVVRIDTYDEPPVAVSNVDFFFRVVKAGFSQKRKQLKNTLAGGLQRSTDDVIEALEAAGVNPTRRAQTLSIEEWGRLAEALGN